MFEYVYVEITSHLSMTLSLIQIHNSEKERERERNTFNKICGYITGKVIEYVYINHISRIFPIIIGFDS